MQHSSTTREASHLDAAALAFNVHSVYQKFIAVFRKAVEQSLTATSNSNKSSVSRLHATSL